MPSNIVLNPTQSFSLSTENDITFIDWDFSPGIVQVSYVSGQPNPSGVDIDTIIKDFLALDTSGNFSYHIRYNIFVANSTVSTIPIVLTGEIAAANTADAIIGYQVTSANLEVTNTVGFQDLGLLPVGLHVYNINLLVQKKNSNDEYFLHEVKTLIVRLNVLNAQAILVTPSPINFGHVIDDALPASQTLNIQTTGDFTIRALDGIIAYSGGNLQDNGLVTDTLREYSGTGTQDIQISLLSGVNTLDAGLRVYVMAAANLNSTGFVQVNIRLYDSNTAQITPETLEFTAVKGFLEADPQELHVECPGAISVSVPLWLNILDSSGDFSNTSIIRAVLSNNLSVGLYEGFINVVGNGITYLIPVTYNVFENVVLGMDLNDINFTDDFETITNFYNSSDFKLRLILQVEKYNYGIEFPETKILDYKLGLFNDRADFFVGRTLNNLMSELDSLSDVGLSTLVTSANVFMEYYKPAKINLQVNFAHQNNNTLDQNLIYTNIQFIKGRKPLKVFPNAAILDFYLDPLRVTSKSFVLFNFYKTTNHQIVVVKNGEIESVTQHVIVEPSIYSYPYRFNNCVPGDVVEIRLYRVLPDDYVPDPTIEDYYNNTNNFISQKYIVFPEGKRSYHIAWENEYGVLDLMEFTGDINFKMGYVNNTVNNYKNFKEFLRKIDGKRSQNVTINTGFILAENTKRLDGLLSAKRAWILNKSEDPVSMVPKTEMLPNYDSDQELYGFDIEFQINLDNDNKVNS